MRSTRIAILLSALRFPVALLTGAAITAGTTYALVKHFQYLIATAGVSPDPVVWRQKARDGFAANACKKTAEAIVPGVECNGTNMWNWADRYPTECLDSLGLIYKAQALAAKKQTYRNQLAVVMFTILAGVLGALVVYRLWSRLFPRPTLVENHWPPNSGRSVLATNAKRRQRRNQKWPFLWRSATVAGLVNETRAYPCLGYSGRANQYFTDANSTISGVVHGWTSSCYLESYTCGLSCTTSTDSTGGTTTSCTVEWCEREVEWYSPQWFVNYMSNRVRACGFEMIDNVAEEVNHRVGNALLEKNWYVKISVSAFYLTDLTDPTVLCLYDIGNH